jgi:hypothetical protein
MSVRPSVCVNEFLRGVFYSGLNKNMDNCLDGNCFAFEELCFEEHIRFIEHSSQCRLGLVVRVVHCSLMGAGWIPTDFFSFC